MRTCQICQGPLYQPDPADYPDWLADEHWLHVLVADEVMCDANGAHRSRQAVTA